MNTKTMQNNLHRAWALSVWLLGCVVISTQAQTTGWNQNGVGPFDYNDPGNWVAGDVNGVWDSSLDVPASQTITVGTNTTANSGFSFQYTGSANLTLRADGTGPYTVTLGGDILHNTGSGTRVVNFGSSTVSQNLNIDLGGVTRTFTVGSGRTLGFVNAISNGGLIVAGGTINFSGANDYSGTTTVRSGNLSLNGSSGSVANSDVTVMSNSGTTTVTFNSNSGSGTTRAKSVTLNGATASGSATATLQVNGNTGGNTTDTITNALRVEQGFGRISLSPPGTRNIRLAAGSFLRDPGTTVFFRGTNLGVNSVASQTAGSGNVTFAVAPTLLGAGGTAGNTDVSILPGAYGTQLGTDTPEGLMTYDATYGVRLLNSATEYLAALPNGHTGNDNVRLENSAGTGVSTTTLAANTAVNTLSFAVSGADTVDGSGITVDGAGSLKVESGTIFASQTVTGQPNGGNAANAMRIDVPTLDLNGREGVIFATTAGVHNGNSNAALFISSVIANDGGNGVTFGGTGQTRLTGSATNTYTGVTTLNSGILRLEKTSGVQTITGDFVMNAGTLLKTNNTIADTSSVTINGGTFWLDSTSSSGNNGTTETILNLTMTGGGLVGSSSGRDASLFVNGDATLSGGTLRLNHGGDVTVSGTTTLSGGLLSARESSSSSSSNGLVSLAAVVIEQPDTGGYTPILLAGHATNPGALVTLNGDLTLTASVGNANTVLIDHTDNALANLGRIALNGTRTFDVEDGAALEDLTVVPLMEDGSGAGGLTKTGEGTLLLLGDHTYTGPTLVGRGTLLVDGTHTGASSYTVGDGGTLGGNGILATTVTVQSGGTLSPGRSTGILTVDDLILQTDSVTVMEVSESDAVPGADYDQLSIFDALSLGGTLSIVGVDGYGMDQVGAYQLFDDFVSVNGNFSAVNVGATALSFSDSSWKGVKNTSTYEFDTASGVFTVGVIPEPASVVLVLLSSLALLDRARRAARS